MKASIALVNMPFASLPTPSIGLTQLKTVVDRQFGDSVDVEIMYLNHNFANFISDQTFYSHVISNNGFSTGIGDWIFRKAAFPDCDDNTEDYLGLYYSGNEPIRQCIDDLLPCIDGFLDDMIAEYGLDRFDIVGFTSIFSQTTASVAMARKLKLLNPDIITVMGGPACIGETGRAFAEHFADIDYVFSGCGLVSFPQFIGYFLGEDMPACERIGGVFSRTNVSAETVAVFGSEADINENIILDYTPFLDALDKAFPDRAVAPRLLFETSRGCWWGEKMPCSFCGLNGPSMCFRAMTSENALKQIHSILEYSDRCSFFASVDNIVPRNYLAEVFPRVSLPPTHKIQYEVRANLEDKDIEALCRAGVTLVQPGIEALSTSTLKLMNKGTSAFSNIRFFKVCSKHPISMVWSLLIFSPGEDEGTYRKYLDDIPRLTHLYPPMAVYPIEFVRYSQYFENQEKYDLDLYPEPSYSLIYPFDDEAVWRMAHRFTDTNADLNRMRYWLDTLGEKIRFWNRRWLNEDNLLESRLCLLEQDGQSTVYDSRLGTALEYPLTPVEKRMLSALEKPLRIEDLVTQLKDIPENNVVKSFDYLFNERGLLFEEDNRYMSLVVL